MEYGHAACSDDITQTVVQKSLLLLSTSIVIFHTSIILHQGLADPFRQLDALALIWKSTIRSNKIFFIWTEIYGKNCFEN